MGFFGRRVEERRGLLDSMDKMTNEKQVDNAAFQHVRANIEELNGVGARDMDLVFLKALMDSPVMKSLIKVQDKLEDTLTMITPVAKDIEPISNDIKLACEKGRSRDAFELARILRNPYFKSLLTTHDKVAEQSLQHQAATAAEKPSVGHLLSTTTDESDFTQNEDDDVDEELSKEHLLVNDSDDVEETSSNGTTLVMETIRMVGLRKQPNEPLGLTVRVDEDDLVVARILGGGMVGKQGLLHVGDIIKEVNGIVVRTPDDLREEVAKAKDSITFRIVPTCLDQPQTVQVKKASSTGSVAVTPSPATARVNKHASAALAATAASKPASQKSTSLAAGKDTKCYMRALFDYNPKEDTLIPCPEIGLEFKRGDILQIMDQTDPNWWQARKIGLKGTAGLVPSQELEERRKAFVAPEADYVHKIGICGTLVSKKKKKKMYESKLNNEFDKAELMIYEEVARMPPFRRKTLVLIGTQGVGRRTLKNRLINSDPERFGTITPHTSRPMYEHEEDGKGYWFASRETLENDIRNNQFLEYGEHNGHIYGTKFDSIRAVVRQGKMCVLDCSPAALKVLYNSPEFMPYVIFISSTGIEQMKQMYDYAKYQGNSMRNLTFDRQNSIRYSSRRARTLESVSSLYEVEDMKKTVEESYKLRRNYEKYFDLVVVNDDFDITFRNVICALDELSTEHQWVPVSWVY